MGDSGIRPFALVDGLTQNNLTIENVNNLGELIVRNPELRSFLFDYFAEAFTRKDQWLVDLLDYSAHTMLFNSKMNPLTVNEADQSTNEAIINFSASGDNIIITGSSPTKIRKIFFVVAAATTITFKDGTKSLTGSITMTAGGSFVLDWSVTPWFTLANNFIINSSSGVQVSGRVYY